MPASLGTEMGMNKGIACGARPGPLEGNFPVWENLLGGLSWKCFRIVLELDRGLNVVGRWMDPGALYAVIGTKPLG